jgi:hypothetical protein
MRRIISETALLSEHALAQDWNRPEEDEAWAHLQSETARRGEDGYETDSQAAANIPIGVKGRIRNDGVSEPYLLVQDDLSNTGGYLILTSASSDVGTDLGEGYDYWVLGNELEHFFQDSGWQVDWSVASPPNVL